MKILCISDAWLPQVNGVVRTYQSLQHELKSKGHDLTVIGPADFPLTLPLPGYPEIRLVLFPGNRLKAKIRTLDPDAIHIATEGPLGRAARKYCLKNKIPFTTCYHTQFPDYIGLRVARYLPSLQRPVINLAIRLLKNFHAPASRLLVVTKNLKRRLETDGYTPPIQTFSRGVDLSQFKPGEKTEFLDFEQPIALYVGRIAIEKNLEAFLKAPWKGSKVVVGDGPELARLKQTYPAVHFRGAQTGEALAASYRSADIFVFPSKTDTFGLVLIEALASGLPIAAFPVAGPLDIVTAPELGNLDDNLGAAMKAAFSCVGSPALRAAHVAITYTWEAAASQFLAGLVSTRQTS